MKMKMYWNAIFLIVIFSISLIIDFAYLPSEIKSEGIELINDLDYFLASPKQGTCIKNIDGSVYGEMKTPMIFSYPYMGEVNGQPIFYISRANYNTKEKKFVYQDEVSVCEAIDVEQLKEMKKELFNAGWILNVQYNVGDDKEVTLIVDLNAGIAQPLEIRYKCVNNLPYLVE